MNADLVFENTKLRKPDVLEAAKIVVKYLFI
jgi:hypothetical protein